MIFARTSSVCKIINDNLLLLKNYTIKYNKKEKILIFLTIFAKSLNQLTMKFAYKPIVAALLLSTLFVFSCKKDDPDDDKILGKELVGTWEQLQPSDITGKAAADFDGFILTITATKSSVNYVTNSATNGNTEVFPGSGSFVVEASDNFGTGATINRLPDDVEMKNVKVSGNKLTFNFNIPAPQGARIEGIDGEYSFSLTKKE